MCYCQKTEYTPTTGVGITGITVTSGSGSAQPTMEPYKFRISKPGKATLHGTLVVLDPSLLPAHDDGIYLVPISPDNPIVSTIPTFTKGEVPQADVDERSGEFMFTDITVGHYAVVVLTIGGAQIPVHTLDSARNVVVVTVDETFINKINEIGKMSLP